MSTIHPSGLNDDAPTPVVMPDDGTDAADTIPQDWLDAALTPPVGNDEEAFLPVLWTAEAELASAEVLAGDKPGRGEVWQIAVMYVSRDGRRRVDETFPARVVDAGDRGTLITPQRLYDRVAVDGDVTAGVRRRVTPRIAEALAALHDIDVTPEPRGVDL